MAGVTLQTSHYEKKEQNRTLTMLATITVLALPPRESAHNRERRISSAKKKQTKQYETKTKQIYIIAATDNTCIFSKHPRIWQFLLMTFFIVENAFIIQFTL